MDESVMTQAELEVWRTVQELNRAWTSGRARGLERFFHPVMVAVTPSDPEPLLGQEACVAAWQRFAEAATIRSFSERSPTVRLFGDAAVVSYGYLLECELGGQSLTLAGRDLFFMVREGGRWQAVADQFSPYPAAVAPTRPAAGAERDNRQALEDTARRWISFWQGGDLTAFDDLHAPGFVDHSAAGRIADRAGFRQGIIDLYQAFPDFHGTIDGLVVDTSTCTVAIRWSAAGKHRALFMGHAPTSRRIVFHGIEIIRISSGRVVERWGEWDAEEIQRQLAGPSDANPRAG
jgi:predicted ester cyclase